jgi:hypothetical protein
MKVANSPHAEYDLGCEYIQQDGQRAMGKSGNANEIWNKPKQIQYLLRI